MGQETNAFSKSGNRHDKIRDTLMFINDMEKEIDGLIEENKKHDAFLDLTRQEKNKIQKVFTDLQEQRKKQEDTLHSSVEESQKTDTKSSIKEEVNTKRPTPEVDSTEQRQRKDKEPSYKRRNKAK